nr:MAG TPA: hypothetical protein [Caudoviricetes sp.]
MPYSCMACAAVKLPPLSKWRRILSHWVMATPHLERQVAVIVGDGVISSCGRGFCRQGLFVRDGKVTVLDGLNAAHSINIQPGLDLAVVLVLFLAQHHANQLAGEGGFIVLKGVSGVAVLHGGKKRLEIGLGLFLVGANQNTGAGPCVQVHAVAHLAEVVLVRAFGNIELDAQILFVWHIFGADNAADIAARGQARIGCFGYVVPVNVFHGLFLHTIIFTNYFIYGGQIVGDQVGIKHADGRFYGVLTAVVGGKQVLAVLHNGF